MHCMPMGRSMWEDTALHACKQIARPKHMLRVLSAAHTAMPTARETLCDPMAVTSVAQPISLQEGWEEVSCKFQHYRCD
jgi:hypothetical protein